MANSSCKAPSASRQLAFHHLLVAARKTWLFDALKEISGSLDPAELKEQGSKFIPKASQKVLAAAGIRDEHVFPLPLVLEARPTLVGYYRLLLGAPQKSFYAGNTGLGQFRSMEARGTISGKQKLALPEFCRAMAVSLSDLVTQMSPIITPRELNDLPILTLGAQLQGANNTRIGREASESVFRAVADIVAKQTKKREATKLYIRNSAGRVVLIILASDPDVSIQETVGEKMHNKVAIEIKGGTDKSNAYNRAGEAEKSHQKAKRKGFRDFWTIISTKGVDSATLRNGSPTTTSWFDAAQVLGKSGDDWDEFRRRIASEVGVPLR
ncbi:MAG: XcyI family restriction endonuclease [Candidatus Acidiferrales bacterium]